MLLISEEQVRKLLSIGEAIECLRHAFAAYGRGEAQNQPRRRLRLSTGSILHSIAGAYGPYFGTKVYSTHPRHGAHFTVLLYDRDTARPLAQIEANHLGRIRTGAASGVVIDLLAPTRALSIGLIGTGFQAAAQLEAVRAVRQIGSVKVWSRSQEACKAFAEKQTADCAATARDAAAGADIVITATSAKAPVFDAEDVSPSALVIAMGSNQPDRRELPAELVNRSTVVVDDLEQCRIEAGDLMLALDEAGWSRALELKHLAGKNQADLIDRPLVFKSVGLGLEDVAVAAIVYEKLILAH